MTVSTEDAQGFSQKDIIGQRRSETARLWNSGLRNISAIARQLGVSRDTVYDDLLVSGIDYRKRSASGFPEKEQYEGETAGVAEVLRKPPEQNSLKDHMDSAIKAANILRTELARKFPDAFTVAPHALPRGGVVSVYLSDFQAEHLAEMVRKYNRENKPAGDGVDIEDVKARSAVILRVEGCSYTIIGEMLRITEEQALELVSDTLRRLLPGSVWLGDVAGYTVGLGPGSGPDEEGVYLRHRCGWEKRIELPDDHGEFLANIVATAVEERKNHVCKQ